MGFHLNWVVLSGMQPQWHAGMFTSPLWKEGKAAMFPMHLTVPMVSSLYFQAHIDLNCEFICRVAAHIQLVEFKHTGLEKLLVTFQEVKVEKKKTNPDFSLVKCIYLYLIFSKLFSYICVCLYMMAKSVFADIHWVPLMSLTDVSLHKTSTCFFLLFFGP